MTIEVLNGVRNWYGSRLVENKFPGEVKNDGFVKTLELPIDYSDMPALSADGAMVTKIPTSSLILSARFYVDVVWVGGTSIAFGCTESDGTAIDPDGLITATQGATANIDAVGDWLVGTGALVGATVGSGVEDAQITSLVVGTYTAGAGRLVVEYLLPKTA